MISSLLSAIFPPQYNQIHLAAFAISDGSERNFHIILGHFYGILPGTGAII